MRIKPYHLCGDRRFDLPRVDALEMGEPAASLRTGGSERFGADAVGADDSDACDHHAASVAATCAVCHRSIIRRATGGSPEISTATSKRSKPAAKSISPGKPASTTLRPPVVVRRNPTRSVLAWWKASTA